MRLALAALASALVAIATLVYVRRPREYAWHLPEPEDGVQPFDPRCTATGLYAGPL